MTEHHDMTKPVDVPQDIWDAALETFDDWRGPGKVGLVSAGSIARAIMAERLRWEQRRTDPDGCLNPDPLSD